MKRSGGHIPPDFLVVTTVRHVGQTPSRAKVALGLVCPERTKKANQI